MVKVTFSKSEINELKKAGYNEQEIENVLISCERQANQTFQSHATTKDFKLWFVHKKTKI